MAPKPTHKTRLTAACRAVTPYRKAHQPRTVNVYFEDGELAEVTCPPDTDVVIHESYNGGKQGSMRAILSGRR